MVDVRKDHREWTIKINSKDCPHLYFPSNYHGCRLTRNGEGECHLENCRIRIDDQTVCRLYAEDTIDNDCDTYNH